MKYLLIIMAWLTTSFLYGIVGTTIGPGAVMILCGLILGVSGALFHCTLRASNFEIKWIYIGAFISVISTFFTVLIIGGDTKKAEIILFLGLFYIIPSYVIYFGVQTVLDRCNKQ